MTYAPSYGFSYYKQVGTSPLEAWYYGGATKAQAPSTAAVAINKLQALPFICERGGTVDRLSFRVTAVGTAGSVARVGIYKNAGDNDLEPGALVVDGGEYDTTATGVKTTTISNVLSPGLYWFAYVCGTAAPTVRSIAIASINNAILGVPGSSSGSWSIPWSVNYTYAALPDPYTAGGASLTGGVTTAIAVRFST